MDYIIDFIKNVVAGAGGAAAVVLLFGKFAVNKVADILEKRYDAKLQEQLETHKAQLGRKEYISKTRFDTEFELYQNLSAVFFELVKHVNSLIPNGSVATPADPEAREKRENEILTKATSLSIEAQDLLNKNAPFIPEEFYNGYDNILRDCYRQIDVIQEKFNVLNFCQDKGKPTLQDYKRTEHINENFRENNNAIRKYLASLDILE